MVTTVRQHAKRYLTAVNVGVALLVASLVGLYTYNEYLDGLLAPLIPEDYRSAPLETFTLNRVSFQHIKGAFNSKWVSTALNEKHVSAVFESVLAPICSHDTTGWVLDVGSNTGIYGLYAAALGCQVRMFEPQPQCQRAIRAALEANGFDGERVKLVPYAVTAERILMNTTNQSQCLTSLSMAAKLNERHSRRLKGAVWYGVPTVRLDQVMNRNEHIELMKIDVEGAEYTVLKSAWKLFVEHQVRVLVIEVSPPWWSQFGVSRTDMAQLFASLWQLGYKHMTVLEAVHDSKRPYTLGDQQAVIDFFQSYPHKQVDVLVSINQVQL